MAKTTKHGFTTDATDPDDFTWAITASSAAITGETIKNDDGATAKNEASAMVDLTGTGSGGVKLTLGIQFAWDYNGTLRWGKTHTLQDDQGIDLTMDGNATGDSAIWEANIYEQDFMKIHDAFRLVITPDGLFTGSGNAAVITS